MAEKITQSEIKKLPLTDYEDIRSKLKSGDLLFTSGNYWVSKAIRKLTDSPWSHVGIVFKMEKLNRLLLLESVEDMGVRFAPLSKYIIDYEKGKPYKGNAVLARCSGIDKNKVNSIADFGIGELTRPYDKDEIAKIVARIALGKGRKERDREYICSELVYECFARAGTDFTFNPKGFISPQDIWVDEKISLTARVL